MMSSGRKIVKTDEIYSAFNYFFHKKGSFDETAFN